MKDGGYGRGGDHTAGTGHSGAGSAGGGGGGGNYTFRGYQSNPNIQGNWNTGGQITGQGSMSRGITPVSQPRTPLSPAPVAAQPLRPVVPPMVQASIPPAIPPSAYPVPSYPPVPSSRLQNYLMEMAAYNKSRQQQVAPPSGGVPQQRDPYANYQTHYNGGGVGNTFGQPSPYGNDQFGHSFGGFGQPGPGKAGGGFGGGGGGGF